VSAQPFGRTIAALEREIGTPLFNRTTRRVELTPAGDKFVSRAEQVLLDVEELVTTVRSAADVESRRIADRHPGCHRADQCPGTRDQHTGPRRRTRLMDLSGAGGLTTAKIVGETANITRFRSEACFAMHAGVAPIPASSGRTQRHRLARGGNRQLNAALHRIAITQVRITASPGQLYYQRRRAQGDTAMEALRALKRRLARVVFNLLQADTTIAINDLSTAA
jgi:hypothetical protein